MKIEVLNRQVPLCDKFLESMDRVSISFTYQWSKMIAFVFKHRPFYLVARDGSEVNGVLPLMHIKSLLFGNRLVSQAFSNYGGPLARRSEAREALFKRAVELAITLRCESIEFRNTEALPYDLFLRSGKANMQLPLAANPEDVWRLLDPKVRNQVRKAEKAGIVVKCGGLELLEEFFRIYSIRMKQLGTPLYSRNLMAGILRAFPNNSRLFIAYLNSNAVGGGLTIRYGGFVEMPYAATLIEYNLLCPNNLLYWSVIKYYCDAGASCFDFGRCTVDSSTYRFKKQWRPVQIDMQYQYWVRPGHELTITSPDNPRYKKRIEIWKRLPLRVANILGPPISRSLP